MGKAERGRDSRRPGSVGIAFGRLGLHRLYLYHAVENAGSCAVAAAAGFVHEGTLRESFKYGDGAYHSEHLHGLLASDLAGASTL